MDFVFFFFKQKTAYEMRISDWSSDVCSSDLFEGFPQRKIDDFVLFEAPSADVALEPEPIPEVPACKHFAGVSPQAASQYGIGGVSLATLILADRKSVV